MAKHDSKTNQPGGAPRGSKQGGALPGDPEAKLREQASVPQPSTERAALRENPNFNQAGNWAGSNDNTSGSQTGADIDAIPDLLPDKK